MRSQNRKHKDEKVYSNILGTCSSLRRTYSKKKSCFTMAAARAASLGIYAADSRACSVLAGVCFSAVLALGFVTLNPACENANALAPEELEGGSLTSSVSVAFVPASGNTSLSPTAAAGASGLISVLANVGVTNSGGYSVYIGSNSTNLVGKNDAANVISGVSGEVSFNNLQDNTWGYYVGEGSFIPETATYKAISQGQGELIYANNNSKLKNEDKAFILGFAAKIDNNIPADIYENQVTLSVISSPYQLTLLDIDSMQDMTPQICENTPNLESKQLKDIRDGKYYWVTKLADNHCWMTQNLDLDLSTSVALTPNDSDVTVNWVPGFNTATIASASTVNFDSQTETRSWSLGDYRIINPANSQSCGYPLADVAACPGLNAASGLTTNRFTEYSTPTSANEDENAHYILGNHYQWNAATAGTGGAITSGQAESSICPKGWKLPESNAATAGTFGGLTNVYLIGSDDAKLTNAPLYFVRGAYIDQRIDYLFAYAGLSGNYWSSAPYSDIDNAYTLHFAPDNGVIPSNYTARREGISVRCIVR